MERGLMWLPLLGAFIWLARAGADEYQKLEAYKRWAVGFDRYKYDIYSVIGIKGRELSWGKPTKQEPKGLQTFSLDRVKQVQLVVDNKPIELEKYANSLDNLPVSGSRANLRFEFTDNSEIVDIPFTEIPMAADWVVFLQSEIDITGAGGG
jgi:hypothetical protein